uniref:Transmembrane protein 231 n=1 Tax=Angiostrongylus cantonensis TaxID=6313 RepID=A0A0K0D318_ANGCA
LARQVKEGHSLDPPACTLRLPMRYEWPLGLSIKTVFIVTRQHPYNQVQTDMDIRYVVVDKLPTSLRNCEIVVKEKQQSNKLFTFTNTVLFFFVFLSAIYVSAFARYSAFRRYD